LTVHFKTIAVADSGVDYTHEDLVGVNFLPGYDFVNEDTDPFDDNGHGKYMGSNIAKH
jgi:subtilisin family serine protease